MAHRAHVVAYLPLLLAFGCSSPGDPASTAAAPPQPASAPAATAALSPTPAPTAVLATSATETHQRSPACTIPMFRFRNGGVARMITQNDGNWCWISLRSGATGAAFLLVRAGDAPSHGTFETAPLGGRSRLYYKPAPGFTGEDSFSVELEPGDAALTVNVTVN